VPVQTTEENADAVEDEAVEIEVAADAVWDGIEEVEEPELSIAELEDIVGSEVTLAGTDREELVVPDTKADVDVELDELPCPVAVELLTVAASVAIDESVFVVDAVMDRLAGIVESVELNAGLEVLELGGTLEELVVQLPEFKKQGSAKQDGMLTLPEVNPTKTAIAVFAGGEEHENS
jgi:hypothetical protein